LLDGYLTGDHQRTGKTYGTYHAGAAFGPSRRTR
jgi:hypothetical protein